MVFSLFDGSLILRPDQSSKINVNFCGVGQGTECMAMIDLSFGPAETDYLKRKKGRDQATANIKDYIDENSRVTEGSNNSSGNPMRIFQIMFKNAFRLP